jgi:hypothetical protein
VKPPRGRKKWRPAAQVIDGGDINIPKAHLGGTDALEAAGKAPRQAKRRRYDARRNRMSDAELQAKVERGELSQIEASSKKYRRYGLRLLKE